VVRVSLVWIVSLSFITGEEIEAEGVQFVDVTAESGITFKHVHGGGGENPQKYFIETMGAGCAFFDYDNDGDLDIYAVNGYDLTKKVPAKVTDALYRNRGDGTFTDVTKEAGIEADNAGYGMGCCVGDYDNDGYADLYVTNYGPNVLYHNNGDGTFTDVTQKAGVGDPRWSTGCAFADYDLDGDLDLYVANYVAFSLEHPGENLTPYVSMAAMEKLKGIPQKHLKAYPHPDNYEGVPDVLYRNNGDGTFTDVTRKAGVFSPGGKGLGVVWGDYDNDGDPDLFVGNDQTPNFLYRNNGNGTFTDVALMAGVAYTEDGRTQASMGVDFGDYNNDNLLDLYLTNFQGEPNALYRNDGTGFFSDMTFPSGTGNPSLPYVGWGTGFFDYNHDGFWDLFVTNGHVLDNVALFDNLSSYPQPNLLFRNTGPGPDGSYRFTNVTSTSGKALSIKRVGRGVAFGDYDNDGDTDLLLSNSNGPLILLRNEGDAQNHWLTLKLTGGVGRKPPVSNRDAIGARVKVVVGRSSRIAEVKSGGSYLSQSDVRLNFGLGKRTKADRIEIRWPSQRVEVLREVPADQIITVREGEGMVGER
jgi:hypothetical protein